MSIPKINISTKKKTEKCNLDFDSFTTSNFGFVQPTMAREMIPGSRFDVQVMSKVRLASMPSPTFGRMYLKHQHVFIPYSDVCEQFKSFISGQNYSDVDGNFIYPVTKLPFMSLQSICQYVLAKYADFTIYSYSPTDPNADVNGYIPITIETPFPGSGVDLTTLKYVWDRIVFFSAIRNKDTTNSQTFYGSSLLITGSETNHSFLIDYLGLSANDGGGGSRGTSSFSRKGRMLCGYWFVDSSNVYNSTNANFALSDGPNSSKFIKPLSEYSIITNDNADYICDFSTVDSGNLRSYKVCFKLTPMGKRIRQILIGLGYQFSPFFTVDNCNFLKLLAFYRAYYCLNNPKRVSQFQSTNCAKLIKKLTKYNWESEVYYKVDNGLITGTYQKYLYVPYLYLREFINDLGYTSAFLPQDYFSMSTDSPVITNESAGNSGNFMVLNSFPFKVNSLSGSIIETNKDDSSNLLGQVDIPLTGTNGNIPIIKPIGNNSTISSLSIQLAQRALRYVNKNSVVGRSIHDWVKAHFGVSINDNELNGDNVYLIGESSTDIYVGDIYSTSETDEVRLGEYAGRGEGSSMSDMFFFENGDLFGVWLTLTTILPKSSFYQGILRENMSQRKFDFFIPEFDACGSDLITRGELMADYPVKLNILNTSGFDNEMINHGFGFVPRSSFYKVGRDIVNGDFSLRGVKNDMNPFHLERQLPYDDLKPVVVDKNGEPVTQYYLNNPSYRVSKVTEEFRRVDESDVLGNYNRIFYYNKPDFDHFLIFNVFSVTGYLPAKSLQNSYDTIDADGDIKEFSHS